eukprot:TRINITY_DN9181_c0_g1_i1.p1 TRINITY_DN9181_c0_g1~~TRINITY_DN9181_c0_g1_i1.p1  ORF type:complete len:238 (+),score=31.35 TRINITY_DN9181_c0_g1_i1:3-716(+)
MCSAYLVESVVSVVSFRVEGLMSSKVRHHTPQGTQICTVLPGIINAVQLDPSGVYLATAAHEKPAADRELHAADPLFGVYSLGGEIIASIDSHAHPVNIIRITQGMCLSCDTHGLVNITCTATWAPITTVTVPVPMVRAVVNPFSRHVKFRRQFQADEYQNYLDREDLQVRRFVRDIMLVDGYLVAVYNEQPVGLNALAEASTLSRHSYVQKMPAEYTVDLATPGAFVRDLGTAGAM